nr:Dak kinase domain containing protein [Haemonchus contortus]
MGVSLYPCSVPGHGKMFEMPNNMMEVGLGIHGEPGCRREVIRDAHQIVDMVMSKLQETIQFTKDEEIVLLINNLGGVSQLEISIIKSEAIKWCREFLFYPFHLLLVF